MTTTSHNSLTVLFEGMAWERLKHVSVDREGEHIFALRPKIDKVTHRLLCDVKLIDNVKVVTFRSTFQVQNRSLVVAEMVIVDANGKKASQVYKIRASLLLLSPIHLRANPIRQQHLEKTAPFRLSPPTTAGSSFGQIVRGFSALWLKFLLIPKLHSAGFGYSWSAESLHWQDLIKRPTRAIVCKSPTEAAFRFQAYASHDKNDPLVRLVTSLLGFHSSHRLT